MTHGTVLFVLQLCLSHDLDCYSFNFVTCNQTCEINSCSRSVRPQHATLRNDSCSSYYEMQVSGLFLLLIQSVPKSNLMIVYAKPRRPLPMPNK